MYKGLIMYSSDAIPPVHPPIPVKPCPFCGGNAVTTSWIVPVDEYEIFAADVACHDCSAKIENSHFGDIDIFDRDAVVLNSIQRWNKRI